MISTKDFTQYSPRTHLYPDSRPEKFCDCGKPLTELYATNPRKIRKFKENEEIVEHVLACTDPECPENGKKLYPVRETPPRSSFHFDVIIEVGRLRREEKKTFKQISQILRDRGVLIGGSASCARHLFRYFEIYEIIWAEQDLASKCQGQDIVLSVDGAKPEKGAATLYLASGDSDQAVLASDWLLYSEIADIAGFLEEIKTLDLNVVGFVSDKQKTILLGVQEVFGDKPHQYCQFHWFKNVFEPLSKKDRQLNTVLKKAAGKIRYVRKATKKSVTRGILPEHALVVLDELENFLTVILTTKNKPPFALAGLKNWYRIKLLLVGLLELLDTAEQQIFEEPVRKIPPDYKSLIRVARVIAGVLEDTLFDYWSILTGSRWLSLLVDYLDPANQPEEWLGERQPSILARERVEELLEALEPSRTGVLVELLVEITGGLEKWQDGLFTCFDYTFLPRTNNKQEQLIYLLKQGQIKTTGRSNNQKVLRSQQIFRYSLSFPLVADFLACCKTTSLLRYQEARQLYFKRLEPVSRQNCIRRSFEKELDKAFAKIKEVIPASVACT